MKKLIISLICFTLLLFFIFSPKIISKQFFFTNSNQIWQHKGGGEYNNYKIENFILSKQKGYKGIEFDLLSFKDKLLVQHDEVNVNTPLLFEKLLPILDSLKMYYWIEFKGKDINKTEILSNFIELIKNYPFVKENCIIETGNIKTINTLQKNEIKVAYQLRSMQGNIIQKIISFIKNHFIISIIQPHGIAMDSSEYKSLIKWFYSRQNKMIWQNNTLQKNNISSKQMNDNVFVILID